MRIFETDRIAILKNKIWIKIRQADLNKDAQKQFNPRSPSVNYFCYLWYKTPMSVAKAMNFQRKTAVHRSGPASLAVCLKPMLSLSFIFRFQSLLNKSAIKKQ